MNIQADVQNLSNLFQSVSSDLKNCNSSVESVSKCALKLANQLNSTGDCLLQFADAVQVISDSASNAKGSTRDIGAELTRFCLRQRALENDVRNWSANLVQFANPLEKRATEWKSRLGEIERRHRKNLKKSSKKQLSPEIASEHRMGCSEILLEQRNQFASFATQLLPVIKAQVRLLEEGVHVKSVEEALENHLSVNEPQVIINAVLEDVIDRNGESWQNRLKSPSKNCAYSTVKRSGSSSSPSSSSVALSWGRNDAGGSIYGTISSVSSTARPNASVNSAESSRRLTISSQTFVPPDSNAFGKPPLPVRAGPSTNSRQSEIPLTHGHSISTADVSEAHRRPGRPLSFSGEVETPIDALSTDKTSLTDTISQLVDQLNDDMNSFSDDPNSVGPHNVIPIRQNAHSSSVPPNSSIQRHSMDTNKMQRPVSIKPPPLPPQRRNSSITAATPTAPSIVDLRNAGLYGRQPPVYNQGPPSAYNNNSAIYASTREFGQRPSISTSSQHYPNESIYSNYATAGLINGQHNDSIDPLPEPPNSFRNSYQPPSTYDQPVYDTNVIYRNNQP
ncbi:IRSp53/MIM-like proteiny domain (IMD)-containing protein [Aphelenchoides besseyi]|nr:IRSp53/MIM-like proteiny domain (IMD)-containing protein [Aphelenchoides besseyi]KAI6208207.1 IRSp53/MIM-like proteiny domain (IMD)-containing protein [Aphelenchoides besseyi]